MSSQMEKLADKDAVDRIMQIVNQEEDIEKVKEILELVQAQQQDLKALNDTLLPALQINDNKEDQITYKSFTKQYLGLPEKTYSYIKLISTKDQKDKSKEKQQLPPFLPNYSNINDVNANSKQLLKKSSIGVSDRTPNLSHLLSSTIKSTFYGEHKATYPTIIYEGDQPHPIRNYGNSSLMESKALFNEGLQTLGGIKDSLSKIGLQSVALKKRNTLSHSKYSHINPDHMKLSNTRVSKIQEPPPPAEPIQNPFVRRPSSQRK